MKYLRLYEDFNKEYISGLLNFEITEKAKKWFENPILGDSMMLNAHPFGEYKIDKVGKLEYFFQNFPVVITNTITDKLHIEYHRSHNQMQDLVNFYSKPSVKSEYSKISVKLANASYGNQYEKDISGMHPGSSSSGRYAILIGKGSLEYSQHEENSYKPKFNYYATVGVSIQNEKLIFAPRIVITMEDREDMEIVQVLFEIWGGGSQYNTIFEIDYNKLVNKEKYEDQHGWFRLHEVKIQRLGPFDI